ncbi:MAG: hypothetical protein WBW33_06415 [Bryobacteraceae bacterium]
MNHRDEGDMWLARQLYGDRGCLILSKCFHECGRITVFLRSFWTYRRGQDGADGYVGLSEFGLVLFPE